MSVHEAYKDYVNAVADAMRDRCARGLAVRAYVSTKHGNEEDAQEFDVWFMDAPVPEQVPHLDPKQTPVIQLPLSATHGPGTMQSYMPFLNVFYNTFSDVYVQYQYFYQAQIVHVALLETLFALLHKDGILTMPVPLVPVEHVSEHVLRQYVELGVLLAPSSGGGAYRINPHSAYLYMYEFLQTGPFRVPSARQVLEHTLHIVEQLEPSFPLLFYVQDPQSKLLTPAGRRNITTEERYYVRVQRKVVRAPPVEHHGSITPSYAEVRKRPTLPPELVDEPIVKKEPGEKDEMSTSDPPMGKSAVIGIMLDSIKKETDFPSTSERVMDITHESSAKSPAKKKTSRKPKPKVKKEEQERDEFIDVCIADRRDRYPEEDQETTENMCKLLASMPIPLPAFVKEEEAIAEEHKRSEEDPFPPDEDEQREAELLQINKCIRLYQNDLGSEEDAKKFCEALEKEKLDEHINREMERRIAQAGEWFNKCVKREKNKAICEHRLSDIGVEDFIIDEQRREK